MTTEVAGPSAAPMTYRDVLRLTVMRRVWYAQIVSLLGDFIALFAVISVVSFRLHGTPAQVTGVQIAYMLPFALLAPISGVFVDRWPVKPTLVASDLIRAALVVLLVLPRTLWQIYGVLVALSAVSTFFAPAQSVTIRQYVGLILSGVLAQVMGVRAVFAMCAVLSWVLAAAGRLLLHARAEQPVSP